MSKRQEGEIPQPSAVNLVNSGTPKKVTLVSFKGDEHFQGRTNSQRENLTLSTLQQALGDLQPPVVGLHQGPQLPRILCFSVIGSNSV